MTSFENVRTIVALISGLSITHLLKGIISFVQHPTRAKPYWVHLLWCAYVLLLIIHFWWWESNLQVIAHWNFALYFFLFCYISVYYFVSSLLIPDNIDGYEGFFAYYYSRKKWIFSILAATFLLDFIDTYIKGRAYYLSHYGWEYPVRNISHIVLCIVATNTNNRKFHSLLVIGFLLYEVSYIYRLFLFY